MAFTSNLRNSRISEDKTGLVSDPWAIYFRDRDDAIAAAPATVAGGANVVQASQNAAIGTTPIATGTLAAGLYRVSAYARVTTTAGVSSSLTTSISFTDGGAACSMAGTAMTSNSTLLPHSDQFFVHIDGATPISYTTAYASNPAAAMVYTLRLSLELVAADV